LKAKTKTGRRPNRERFVKRLEFFFDFGSPTTYLAYTQLPALAERTGAEIVYRPMLLGGVFKATGNASPAALPAKGKWMGFDMGNFARRYGVPFSRNPFFPINTITLMRGAVAMQREGKLMPYMAAIFPAIWVEGKNLGDAAVVAEVLTKAGFDPAAFQAAVEQQEVKDELKANTEEAVSRGVFGAPTFFVGENLYFGQDRLEFVEAALKA
jgi:2-hydroxychromene-2-carboxylate isomerase